MMQEYLRVARGIMGMGPGTSREHENVESDGWWKREEKEKTENQRQQGKNVRFREEEQPEETRPQSTDEQGRDEWF